jgi:putative hydrolase of the HAD superfamily
MSFAHVRDWVFDLDNTLYAAETALYDDLGARMTAYVARAANLSHDAAFELQERYFHQYGATVVGLVAHHGVDADDFLTYVHDVDLAAVAPDPELTLLIEALPGRKFVFTNGGGGHAERVVARLGLAHCFDGLFDIADARLEPKPQPGAYARLIEKFALDPACTLLIEDTLRNLEPAAALGFTTALVGPVHPEPRPPYVHACARDVKTLLADLARIDRSSATA